MLAHGLSNVETGQQLFITENTVKTHVARILTKTGARDRTRAVILAYDAGLVTPGE
jgi:DNA-binding NarL/FixJ family response regulator